MACRKAGRGAGRWVEARLPYRLGDQLSTNAASQLVLVATAAAVHRPAVITSRGAIINALPSHISARPTVGMDAGVPGPLRASAAPSAAVARFTAELRQWVDEREWTTAGGSFCVAELLVGQAGARWAAVSRDCALQAVKALTAEVPGISYSAHAYTCKCAEAGVVALVVGAAAPEGLKSRPVRNSWTSHRRSGACGHDRSRVRAVGGHRVGWSLARGLGGRPAAAPASGGSMPDLATGERPS